MKTVLRDVLDLSPEELDELREAYFEQPDSYEVFDGDISNITDDVLYRHYEGLLFHDEDFACNC